MVSWLVDETEWHWGFITPPSKPQEATTLSKAFLSEKFRKNDRVHDISNGSKFRILLLLIFKKFTFQIYLISAFFSFMTAFNL